MANETMENKEEEAKKSLDLLEEFSCCLTY